ncbi:hypothetical protein GCM10011309_21450 [Litorimonas cladophorae]|uniref:Glycerophosphoryl diester phosphodiesterase membrane domain-containing protein n=1 Tax=Litorimonas cladophorae TaxID=1220491 RepID=A0A918NGB5_9PROT|nr:hypothetical protein [Litorimonas cladophorae]GGX71005.1 hypothetical protein GCM10011309_21450 [Litorimonas cladophorae]
MTYTDPGAPEYEFDWQNPNRKTFDFGRVMSNAFTSLLAFPKPLLIALIVGLGFTVASAILMTTQLSEIVTSSSPEEFILEGAYWGWTAAVSLFGLLLTVWFQLVVIQTSYASITGTDVPANTHSLALRLTIPMFVTALIYTIVCYIGTIPLLIGFIFVWPGWALAGPMMVHENKGIFSSLGAAWTFAKGNKRYIILLLLVITLIGVTVYSVALGIGMVLTGVNVMGGDPTAAFNMSLGQQLIYNGIAGLGGYVMYALFAASLTAAYVEIKTINGGTASVGDVFT